MFSVRLESLFSYQTLTLVPNLLFSFQYRGDVAMIPYPLSLYRITTWNFVTRVDQQHRYNGWLYMYLIYICIVKKNHWFSCLDRVEFWIVKTSPFYPGKCNVYGEVVKENCFLHIFFHSVCCFTLHSKEHDVNCLLFIYVIYWWFYI